MPVEPYGGEMDLEGGWDYENRMVEPGYTPEDQAVENPLRPRTFSEYIGQDKVKENLKIYIEAAKNHAGGHCGQRAGGQSAHHQRPGH